MTRPDPAASLRVTSQISELAQRLRRSFNRYARHTELTYPQVRVIGMLNKEQGIRQAVLAQRLDIQPISLARLIDRMEMAGWVERRPDPLDRRAVQLFLTGKSQPLLKQLHKTRGNFESDVLANFSDSEIKQLQRLLDKLATNLKALDSD